MKKSKFSLGIILALAGLLSLALLAPGPARAQVKKINQEAPSAPPPASPAPAKKVEEAAPAPAPEEGGERVVLHMVHEGEELHMLAAYYYGDARRWPEIYQANRDLIKNPNKIAKGTILSIAVPEDWQPYMPYEKFFQKAVAGGPPWRAAVSSPAEEVKPEETTPEAKKPEEMKPEEKKAEEKKPEGKKPEEKKAPEKKS